MENHSLVTEKYHDNYELQEKLLEAVLEAKLLNPFSAVTLLVENPLQGTLLRRQLIELAGKNSHRAIANFNVMTPVDLVILLSGIAKGIKFEQPKIEHLEAVIFFLMNQEDVGDDSEQSMATASAVAKVFNKLQFVPNKSIESLIASESTNSTQKYVYSLILAARQQLNIDSAAEVCINIAVNIKKEGLSFLNNQTGTILSLIEFPANSLKRLLEEISLTTKVIFFEQAIDEVLEPLSTENTILVSCPDPFIEVSMLSRELMQSLKTVRADRVAIIYPEESEYGNQVRDALDEAGIQWHGNGRTFSQSSVICKGLDLVLEILSERTDTFSGLDRPRLMRLFESGHFSLRGAAIDFAKIRRWIRRQELYSDCISWISVLDDVAENDFDPENSLATELKAFLSAFEEHLKVISRSVNWENLGKSILALLEEMYSQSELTVEGSLEEESWRRIRGLLLGELSQLQPLLSGMGSFKFLNEVMNLRNMIKTKLGDRPVSHGNLSTGVALGDYSATTFLTFDKIFVLGATEGLLPSVSKEDPYLPAEKLADIHEYNMAAGAATRAFAKVGQALRAVVSQSTQTVVLRPRGGTKIKLENEPSRFLGRKLNEKKNSSNSKIFMVENWEHSFTIDLGSGPLVPIINADFTQLQERFIPGNHLTFAKSIAAWRDPISNEYFGNLTVASQENPIWSPSDSKPLSSSSIDNFITCRYQFLMMYILNFNISDRSDVLEDFNPTKFGSYFHKQMENFVVDCIEKGVTPGPGLSWDEDAAELFIREYFLKNIHLFINRGQAGWTKSFEFHLNQVLRVLPKFFKLDASELRQNPDLVVYKPEFSFGYEGDEVELTIVDESNSATYHIRGAIDRLDVSPDRNFAAVLDFKTGKMKSFQSKLQITERGALAKNRKTVQDIIYRLVALKKFDQAKEAKVVFVFIPNEGEIGFLHAKFAHDPEQFLIKTLRSLKDSGDSGDFGSAGDLQGDHAYCMVCKKIGVRPTSASDTSEGEGVENE